MTEDESSRRPLFEPAGNQRRRSLRFRADPGSLARIDFSGNSEQEPVFGLVIEESAKGCSVVIHSEPGVWSLGQRVILTPGKISPLSAEVRWIKTLDDAVLRVGFQYLE